MAFTNFAALQPQQKVAWGRVAWQEARDMMFINKFAGDGPDAMIQRITELTKTEKGDRAIIHLIADLVGDGQVGDGEREGHEEEIMARWLTIDIDLINKGVINKGKLSDQKSVVEFRKHARPQLSYWLANRMDQLAILTMSGISYLYHNNGRLRSESEFNNLSFANDVSAPTANRHRRWDAVDGLVAGDTTAVAAADTPSYKMLVDACAYAKEHYIRPLTAGGREYYTLLMKPGSYAELKKDADFQRAVTTALPRDANNPWFTGATVTTDGLVIHEHRLVYSTSGAASGSKWGASGTVNGSRTLLCGAQALAMVDLGPAEWSEKNFEYDSRHGINVDKMFGFRKPVFHSIYDNSEEDFGVLAIDHALPVG